MSRFFTSFLHMIKGIFDTTSPISLKECYRVLLVFDLLNFILIVFWAINPFQWTGIASLILDLTMILYGLIMITFITATLIRRFKDAGIHTYQAGIFPLSMTALWILVRLRSYSEVFIIVILSIYFLSHFYLLMLVMMPTKEIIQDEDDIE